jgi:hypothetical protein
MKILLLLCLFIGNLAFAQRFPHYSYPEYCSGRDMYSNFNQLMYQFSFSSDCTSALNQSRMNRGRFCDREKLIREDGSVAHLFNLGSDCSRSLMQLNGSYLDLFCDRGDLTHIYRGFITDMTFRSKCDSAVFEATQFRGHFCRDGVMMDYLGRSLRDYTFNSNCRRALQQTNRSL